MDHAHQEKGRDRTLLNNLDRVMKEGEEEGDGSIEMRSVNTDWTDFDVPQGDTFLRPSMLRPEPITRCG